jgi:hypothetical protein
MGKVHFPQTGGQQWVDSKYYFGEPSGAVRYVHAGSGSSAGPGFSPETAYATIDQAISASTADNGDVVLVLEDHTESVVGAAGIAADVAGVRIIGLGVGRNRPRITFTTDVAASLDISAARVSLENVVLINAIDSQTAMVNVSGADVTIKGCEIQTGDGTTQAVLGILTTAGATRLRIEENHIHGLVTAGTTSQISIVGGDSLVIKDNLIFGACATTGNISAATTASLNGTIIGNVIQNQTADGNNKTIVLGAGDTYMIVNNRMAVIDSTGPAPVTAAGAYVSGNYWTGGVGVTASTLM